MSGNQRRPGLFGRIGNWFQQQRIQYDLQKMAAERDNAAREYLAYQDNECAQRAAQAGNPYDAAMSKYEFRSMEQQRLNAVRQQIDELEQAENDRLKAQGMKNPELGRAKQAFGRQQEERLMDDRLKIHGKAGARHQELTARLGDLGNITGDDNAIREFLGNPRGKGIGAFFGRLFNGRLSKETRQEGMSATMRIFSDTMYSRDNKAEVVKLTMREQQIRSGELTVEQVLDPAYKVPEVNSLMETEIEERAARALRGEAQPQPEPQSEPQPEPQTEIDVNALFDEVVAEMGERPMPQQFIYEDGPRMQQILNSDGPAIDTGVETNSEQHAVITEEAPQPQRAVIIEPAPEMQHAIMEDVQAPMHAILIEDAPQPQQAVYEDVTPPMHGVIIEEAPQPQRAVIIEPAPEMQHVVIEENLRQEAVLVEGIDTGEEISSPQKVDVSDEFTAPKKTEHTQKPPEKKSDEKVIKAPEKGGM